MSNDDKEEDRLILFKFYVDGLVQYSVLTLTSTLGVFSPLDIIIRITGWSAFKITLVIVYIIFSIASAFFVARLFGTFLSMVKVMPTRIMSQHKEFAKSDLLALSSKSWIINLANSKIARNIQALILASVLMLYLLLLLFQNI